MHNIEKKFPIITQHTAIACSELNSQTGFAIVEFDDQLMSSRAEVAFVMPNEKVQVEKLQYRRDRYFYFREILDNPHQNRIKPVCEHFSICGGCLYQHMDWFFYAKHKIRMLRSIIDQENLSLDVECIKPIQIIGPNLRRKANFEAIKKNDQVFLGFHRYGSRQIINLNFCHILDPRIANLLPKLKILLQKILLNTQKCEFFIIVAQNQLDIAFEIHKIKQIDEHVLPIIKEFCVQNQIDRFVFHAGKKQELIFESEECKKNQGIYLQFGNYQVGVNSYAFMQTSPQAEEAILQAIIQCLPDNHKNLVLVDLFCGRGTYSLNLFDYFDKIIGVELAGDAVLAFSEVVCKYSLQDKIEIQQRDLFINPLGSDFFNNSQLVVINPPRAGALTQCVQLSQAIKNGLGHIIYVSCNPKTFVNDAKILIEAGYVLQTIKPVDQFIWSNHLEIVAYFNKN